MIALCCLGFGLGCEAETAKEAPRPSFEAPVPTESADAVGDLVEGEPDIPEMDFDEPSLLVHPDEGLRRSAAIGGVLGTLSDTEGEVVALVTGVTAVLNANLPDCDAVLVALGVYREEVRSRAESLGKIFRPRKIYLKRRNLLKRYAKRQRQLFSGELAAYQRAVALFEQQATPEQILRFNAAIKGLIAPILIK